MNYYILFIHDSNNNKHKHTHVEHQQIKYSCGSASHHNIIMHTIFGIGVHAKGLHQLMLSRSKFKSSSWGKEALRG